MLEKADVSLVTVIVPAYNSSKYLVDTIESLVLQTHKNIEIILVDDGSTDSTLKIANDCAEKDRRILVIQHDTNRGESAAINSAWKIARGHFVGIVSSDDPQDSSWLVQMLSHIQNYPGFTHYYPDRVVIDEFGRAISKDRLHDWKFETLAGKMICIASAGTLINKSILPSDFLPRDETLVQCSDLGQMLLLSEFGNGERVASVYGVWRKHSDNLSYARNLDSKISEFERLTSVWMQKNLPYGQMAALHVQARVYVFLQKSLWSIEQLGIVKGTLMVLSKRESYFHPLFKPVDGKIHLHVISAFFKVIVTHARTRFSEIPNAFRRHSE